MAQIFNFNLNSDQLLELAISRHEKGDIVGAALAARKAIKADKKNSSAYLVLALIYADDHEFELSNQVLYIGMNACDAWDDPNFKRGVTLNFMHLDDFDAASSYVTMEDPDLMDIIDDELDFEEDDFKRENTELYLSYPRSEEYYHRLIDDALELVYMQKFEEAQELFAEVPEDMACREDADRAALMTYSLCGDFDAMFEYGKSLVEKHPDSVMLRSMLASAYLARDKDSEAYETVYPVLQKDNVSVEEALALIPIVISIGNHADAIRLIKTVLDNGVKPDKHFLYLLSQALYNVGENGEARRIMAELRDYFGELSNAEYMLGLYAEGPKNILYSLDTPKKDENRVLDTIYCLSEMTGAAIGEFAKTHTDDFDNLDYYFQYAAKTGKIEIIGNIIERTKDEPALVESLCRNCLVIERISFKVLALLISTLTDMYAEECFVEFNIVVRDRFQHVKLPLPFAYPCLTKPLLHGLLMAIADVILNEVDATEYLKTIDRIFDTRMYMDKERNLCFHKKQYEKLRGIRDAGAFTVAILYKVYEKEEDLYEDIVDRYEVNMRLVEKYKKILYGEADE